MTMNRNNLYICFTQFIYILANNIIREAETTKTQTTLNCTIAILVCKVDIYSHTNLYFSIGMLFCIFTHHINLILTIQIDNSIMLQRLFKYERTLDRPIENNMFKTYFHCKFIFHFTHNLSKAAFTFSYLTKGRNIVCFKRIPSNYFLITFFESIYEIIDVFLIPISIHNIKWRSKLLIKQS